MTEIRHDRFVGILWQAKWDIRSLAASTALAKQVFASLHPIITQAPDGLFTADESRVLMAYGMLARNIDFPHAYTELSERLNMSQTEINQAFHSAIQKLATSPDVGSVLELHGVTRERKPILGPAVAVTDQLLQLSLTPES
jgi:hypothetical protein